MEALASAGVALTAGAITRILPRMNSFSDEEPADRVAEPRYPRPASALTPSLGPSGEALRAWMRLANLQFTPRLTTALLARFGSDPQAVFAATDAELDAIPGFLERHRLRLRDPNLNVTDRQWAWVEKQGVWLLLLGQAAYPHLLRQIPDPPPILFVRGTLPETDGFGVGLVGSRHATPYGRATAERLARELAGHGLTVVSGGAVGIDAAAHRGAIEGGGHTLALLGCGLDVDYPRDNRALFELIAGHGALISEYPLGAQPEGWRFPQRNRLISGLSLGILVVEAPWQSGALITARYAAEQNRPVMAIPGNIDRPSSAGTNELLKDGAILVTETDDVLRALNLTPLVARSVVQPALDLEETAPVSTAPRETTPAHSVAPASTPSRKAGAPLPESQLRLLDCLSLTPRHLDAIAQEAGISSVQASAEMTMLELSGHVRRLPGNAYIRIPS